MDINVYVRLKSERERLNLSQAVVAAQTEVNIKTVGRWEKEISIPSDKLALLRVLGFDVFYVLTGERLAMPTTEIERQLVLGIKKLDIPTQNRMLGFINSDFSAASVNVVNQATHTGSGTQNNAKKINIPPAQKEGENTDSVKISAKGKKSQAAMNITNNR